MIDTRNTQHGFKVNLDDLQEQHRPYADIIGIDNLIALSEEFGGTPMYVPTKKELLKNTVYGAMMDEYDGTNIKQLAVKYGISISTAYKVLEKKIKTHKANPFPGEQVSLF